MMLRFRPLTSSDFPLLLKWLSKEHVKQWWNDGDETLEQVAQHYGEEEEGLERFILVEVEDNGEKPVGYFQHYFIPDGLIGIDQFIGEGDYLGLPEDHPLRFGTNTGADWDAHVVFLHPDDREQTRRPPLGGSPGTVAPCVGLARR